MIVVMKPSGEELENEVEGLPGRKAKEEAKLQGRKTRTLKVDCGRPVEKEKKKKAFQEIFPKRGGLSCPE